MNHATRKKNWTARKQKENSGILFPILHTHFSDYFLNSQIFCIPKGNDFSRCCLCIFLFIMHKINDFVLAHLS